MLQRLHTAHLYPSPKGYGTSSAMDNSIQLPGIHHLDRGTGQTLPPCSELLKTVPSASFATLRDCSPAQQRYHSQARQQQWPGRYSFQAPQHGCHRGPRALSVPDIRSLSVTTPRSYSSPDIRWYSSPGGPYRTKPRRNSRQEPYSRSTESTPAKRSSKKEQKDRLLSNGISSDEEGPVSRNNTKYSDEQNHFIIYHHDDLEWSWKDIEEAYMRQWPKKGKEQPERTEGALQCAFYRTNSVMPALDHGSDLLVLGHPPGFNHGKPGKAGKDALKKDIPRETYELYHVNDGVPHLLEELKVRATDVTRKLCLRYPEAMLNYQWVRPEDKVKAREIAARRQLQRQMWKQQFPHETYKEGTYLHKWRSVPQQSSFYEYHSAQTIEQISGLSIRSHL